MPTKFQARHYEAIAGVIAFERTESAKDECAECGHAHGETSRLVRDLCILFQDDNPNFDPARFVQACETR